MKILMILIGVIAGVAAGVYGGMRAGSVPVLNACLAGDARDVQQAVAALKRLRAGDREGALELLEARMDDVLIPFDPASPYPGLKDSTIVEINNALREAKAYRTANPRKSA